MLKHGINIPGLKYGETGNFLLTEPVASLPGAESGYAFKALKERPIV